MKILVTGGAGFVGTNLIKKLLSDNHRVVSLDNYSTGKKENEINQKGVQYFDVDLREVSDYSFFMDKPDVIFHLAALARIQPSLKDPTTALNNNFLSTMNVLEFARLSNSAVVYAGSSTFHHGLWGSPYAWSKHAGEQMCELYSKVYGLPTSTCRFYNVYGEHQLEDGAYATVVGIFEKQYREGEQRRDFTHINDIVDALIKLGDGLLSKDNSLISGEIFEFGRGKNFSINELANMFGDDYPKEYLPARDGEYDYTLADSTKAKEILNWNPTLEIKNHISKVISDKD
jgi:nucleoside-diphosphate-sugar epimerase